MCESASQKPTNNAEKLPSVDFETAISATGFGKFNLLLILISIPSTFSALLENAALSYVFPAAQCDLNLTMKDRGVIYATIYAGMITSCFLWGPLTDIFGRRRILIIAHFTAFLVALTTASSDGFLVLLIAKFFGGFIVTGPITALTPYLSEFHNNTYRARVPLVIGLTYSLGHICLPLFAWSVLSQDLQWSFFGVFDLHAWNLFLFVCAIPTLTSALIFCLTMESPRYLMSKGRNEEALQIFRKMYRWNQGSEKRYPIESLVEEKSLGNSGPNWTGAWAQLSPLFSAKYGPKLILMCCFQLFILMCHNTVRLWLPQIFQQMVDYEQSNNRSGTFCQVLATIHTNPNEDDACTINQENSSVYINSTIVGVTTTSGYIIAAFVINRLGKKNLFGVLALVAGLCLCSLYFAQNSRVILGLCATYITCSCIALDIIITITVDIFPTSLRASALSLGVMTGRIGSVCGNILFPYLIETGCAIPFFTLGGIILGCAVMTILLPNTNSKSLE